jgi:hypothetical protein
LVKFLRCNPCGTHLFCHSSSCCCFRFPEGDWRLVFLLLGPFQVSTTQAKWILLARNDAVASTAPGSDFVPIFWMDIVSFGEEDAQPCLPFPPFGPQNAAVRPGLHSLLVCPAPAWGISHQIGMSIRYSSDSSSTRPECQAISSSCSGNLLYSDSLVS